MKASGIVFFFFWLASVVGCSAPGSSRPDDGSSLVSGAAQEPLTASTRGIVRTSEPRAGIAPAAATGGPQLSYGQGPVLSNVNVVVVFWGSNVSAAVQSSISGFFAAATNDRSFDWLSEYNTATQSIGRGASSSVTSYTITPSSAHAKASLANSDIASELTTQVQSGALPPPDSNTLYMIYFPSGVSISLATLNSCASGGFCGYHDYTPALINGVTQTLVYGVIPDFSAGSGCDALCGAGTMFENVTSTSSHELVEAVTDPQLNAWTVLNSPLGSEIGDLCNQQHSTITSGGTTYTIQREWSYVEQACITQHKTNYAFAWSSDLSSKEFSADPGYSANSYGLQVTDISNIRAGAGQSQVLFPVVGQPATGNVQVVAYGGLGSTGYCSIQGVNSIGSGPSTLRVRVNCFAPNGTPANGNFAISYEYYDPVTPATPTGPGAYLRSDQLATAQWNSAGLTNTVTHSGTGTYTVHLPGVRSTPALGNVQITAVASNARCSVISWGTEGAQGEQVHVRCDAPSGQPVDSAFSLRFSANNTIESHNNAYAFFDQASTASFTPATNAQFGQSNQTPIANGTGTRLGTGSYTYHVHSMDSVFSTAMVTAVFTAPKPTYCSIFDWVGSGDGTDISINCFDFSGVPTDSRFMVSYGAEN